MIVKINSRLFFLIVLLCLKALACFAQSEIPLGTWRTHFSYDRVEQVVSAGAEGRVYAATANTIFYFDREDQSINKITQIDGLSDVGISSLYYDRLSGTLLIGYASGLVDFLQDNTVTVFDQIANATQLQEKKINSIAVDSGFAYFGISVGVVVVDLGTNEIFESYTQIGPNASQIEVRDIVLEDSEIFLATPLGLLSATISDNINLQDFNNWTLSQPPQQSPNFTIAESYAGQIYCTSGQGLAVYDGSEWQDASDKIGSSTISNLRHSESQLSIITLDANGSKIYDQNYGVALESPELVNDVAALNGQYYLATNTGLIAFVEQQGSKLGFQGPFVDQLGILKQIGGQTIGFRRIENLLFQDLSNSARYSVFSDGAWDNNEYESFLNAYDIAKGGGKTYLASLGSGLYNETEMDLIDQNTPGSPLTPSIERDDLLLISALATGNDGDLWVANYDTESSLHQLSQDGSWRSVRLSSSNSARFPIELEVSNRTGAVWVRVDPDQSGGIYVFDPDENLARYVTAFGNLIPSNQVNAIAIDRNDEVWVGTESGIAFFQTSRSPFLNGFSNAIVPVIDGELLLRGENVSSVEVDGGNRKWVGTDNGLWLISENGDEIIHYFTSQNSPLPSNQVLDVAINGESGEVFISTDRGMISYRSDATSAGASFGDVRIFPNPVPPNFTGNIAFTGLAADVNVKITDLGGQLVHEGFANGGTASWNGLDIGGNAVQTGIYLIFASDNDGTETFVGKFAVVR